MQYCSFIQTLYFLLFYYIYIIVNKIISNKTWGRELGLLVVFYIISIVAAINVTCNTTNTTRVLCQHRKETIFDFGAFREEAELYYTPTKLFCYTCVTYR